MNCAMLSRSVGSVFSSRRISCLAVEGGCDEVVEPPPQASPTPGRAPPTARSARAPKFLTHSNNELITASVRGHLSSSNSQLTGQACL